jgi:GntR family transcriptional regulator/MocR family aminotransferase
MRVPAQPAFPITVIRDGGPPLPEQIATQIGAAVAGGLHGRLPSTRTLAGFLGVSRGVTAAAYDLLAARGMLVNRPGSGAYARRCDTGPRRGSDQAAHRTDPGSRGPEPAGIRPDLPWRSARTPEPVDLRPVVANDRLFPVAEWRSAWRDATFRPPAPDAPPALGLTGLREAVAAHVRAALGVRLTNRQVIVTAGRAAGLRLVRDLLRLDSDQLTGTVTGGAPAKRIRAVVTGADAREPGGVLMPQQQREQLAAWARRTGGVVVDVAGDTGLSAAARRLPRLIDVTGELGILLGGFGDAWAAALDVGFAIVPTALAAGWYPAQPPGDLAQRAMTALLRSGAVDRLNRRLDRLAGQRDPLVRAAFEGLPGVRYEGGELGGVAVLALSRRIDAGRVAAEVLARGVRVGHLSGPPRLVLGYLRPGDDELRRALATVRSALD